MRIDRLDLIRYGAFQDKSLDFDPEAAVTIVYGPNEAGKSTALEALGDLLFDFPLRSAAAFRFKTSDLRLGGAIRGADGARLEFHRRKGSKAVLRAPEDDRPLPDDALAPFLGVLTREAFQELFGLDAERLREGGQRLLDSGGALGETLLSASGVMADAEARRAGLAEQAGALFNPGRKTAGLPLYKAFEDYQAARKRFEGARVTAREVDAARAAMRDAAARLSAARRARQEAEDAAALAERAKAAAPKLRALDQAQAACAPFEDLASVPTGAGATLARLLQEAQKAERGAAEAAGLRDAAAERLAEAPEPGPALAEQAAIEALAPLLAEAEGAMRDLPGLHADLDQAEATCAALARRLGVRREALAEVQLTDAERADLGRVIAEGTRLAARGGEAAALAPDLLDAAEAGLRALRGIGGLFGRRSASAERAEAAARMLAEGLDALPCFAGDADVLAATAPPTEAEIARFADAYAALDRAAATAQDRAAAREAERVEIEARLEAGVATAPPGVEEIAAARKARDAEWRRIRAQKFGDVASPETDDGPASPDRFEARISAADDVADRRAADAERAERIARDRRRCAQLQAEAETAEAEAAQRQARRAALDAEWRDAWGGLSRAPAAPAEMAGWSERRARLLADARAATALAAERDAAAAALDSALAQLSALGARVGETLWPVREAAAAEDAVERLRMRVMKARERAEAEQARAVWRQRAARWNARLGLAADLDDAAWIEAADAAQRAVAEIPQALDAAGRAGRLSRLAEERLEALAAAVVALAERLPAESAPAGGAGWSAAEAAAQARRWAATLREDLARAGVRAQLDLRLENAETAAQGADRASREAEAALEEASAGLGVDRAGLPAWIERIDARDAALAALSGAERAVLEASGGRAIDALRAAVADRDDDALAREAAERRAAADSAVAAHEAAVRDDETARRDSAALEKDRGATLAARAMEAALAEASSVGEDWLRLRAGDLLLGEAIRRYRESTSNPMLERASGVFAALTGGSFVELGVAFDDDGSERLVGRRADGEAVAPGGMSEGARDQLFLAMRIAAIERWVESRTPAPFVGDDLFASFDDARAAAGFRALAELGRSTQVLLFTHHRHLVEIGRQTLGDRVAVLPLDPAQD